MNLEVECLSSDSSELEEHCPFLSPPTSLHTGVKTNQLLHRMERKQGYSGLGFGKEGDFWTHVENLVEILLPEWEPWREEGNEKLRAEWRESRSRPASSMSTQMTRTKGRG